ncbi:Hypothetical protein A7982_03803 [Minicystis rosea]|nr:Hypothetical protein A7982_03803 [Minicystis rosea]
MISPPRSRRALVRHVIDRAITRVRATLQAQSPPPSLLLALFLVALWPRLSFVDEHPPGLYLVSDMAIYRERALRMLDGPRDVWDTFTPPGYPALVALIFAAFGRNDAHVGLLQAALGAATVVLAFLVAHRVSGSIVAALGAFTVLALYPPLLLYTGFFLTETTFAFLVALFVVAFVAAVDRASPLVAAASGVVFAAASAVRPNLLLAIPFLAVVILVLRREPRVVRAGVIAMLAALPVLAAVSRDNSRLAGRPVLLATNGGVNFYLAHADVRGLRFPAGDAVRELSTYASRARRAPVEEVDIHAYDDAAFYARGLASIRHDRTALRRSLGAIADGLGAGAVGGRENPPYWPGWMGHDEPLGRWLRAMLALGTVPAVAHAAWLARRRKLARLDELPRLLVLALLASVIATLSLFLGNPRVRVSFDPLLIALAAAAWGALARAAWIKLRSRRGASSRAP